MTFNTVKYWFKSTQSKISIAHATVERNRGLGACVECQVPNAIMAESS